MQQPDLDSGASVLVCKLGNMLASSWAYASVEQSGMMQADNAHGDATWAMLLK